jgi:hypothetical protein
MRAINLLIILSCASCSQSKDYAPYIKDNAGIANIQTGITAGQSVVVDAAIVNNQPAPVDAGHVSNGYVPPSNSEILDGPCSTSEPHVCYKFLGYLGGNAECFLGKQICEDGGWSQCADVNGFVAPNSY